MNTHNHPVHLEKYNQDWPKQFEAEKERLFSVLKDYIVEIEHIGSTAVAGLDAKPIIDIMIGAKDEESLEKCIEPLVTLGYEYRKRTMVNIPGRKFFKRYTDINKGYHIHCVVFNSEFWKDRILFRDYLKNHQEDMEKYRDLKLQLAEKFKNGRKAYLDGKDALIQEIMQKAKL